MIRVEAEEGFIKGLKIRFQSFCKCIPEFPDQLLYKELRLSTEEIPIRLSPSEQTLNLKNNTTQ